MQIVVPIDKPIWSPAPIPITLPDATEPDKPPVVVESADIKLALTLDAEIDL